ncbi:site-2 protease family protein [Pseudactinotalea sp. Z1732]|uniref:site-2 protease family protein n=1 Tax=Micrococcales TaxID=85006 RepID=UPI003C7C0A4D
MRRSRTRGWRIGRIAGTPLILGPGSVVLGAVLYVLFLPTFQALLGDSPRTYLIAALLPAGLLASILVHEVAHGLTARLYGVPVTEYVLTLWGGHTAFDHGLDRPGRSAVVSVAGPAANALIAGLMWIPITAGRGSDADVMLSAVVYVNAVLAAFNLLPGLPMDGGRILEAAVWKLTGNRASGTMVAARGGQVLALGVALWGLWPLLLGAAGTFRLVWAVLIAGVLWFGAQAEVRRAKAQRATAGVDLSALVQPALVLPETTSLTDWDRAGGGHTVTVLTAADGAPTGLVQHQAAASVPAPSRPYTTLGAVSVPVPPVAVISTTRGSEAVAQVARAAQAGAGTIVVLGAPASGRTGIRGVLDVKHVIDALGA